MKKSQIGHGALFAIPLWNNIGYLYGKLLFGSHLQNEGVEKRNIYVKVYDYYTAKLERNFSQGFFEVMEIFTYPFILSGFPKIKGENSWTFLRHDPIYKEDEIIPHYWQPGMIGELNISDNKIFRVVKFGNMKIKEDCLFPYYRIKHLPIHRIRSYDVISLFLTYTWLTRNEKDVDEPFHYEEGLEVKNEIRFEVLQLAVDYRMIPKEIRGRVAPEKNG